MTGLMALAWFVASLAALAAVLAIAAARASARKDRLLFSGPQAQRVADELAAAYDSGALSAHQWAELTTHNPVLRAALEKARPGQSPQD